MTVAVARAGCASVSMEAEVAPSTEAEAGTAADEEDETDTAFDEQGSLHTLSCPPSDQCFI
jgi:hypothetical protein